MSGQERFVFVAEAFKSFQLTAKVDATFFIPAYVERYHSDRVAGYEIVVRFFIVKGESENAVQFFEKADALVFVQGKDNLAVAPGLEGILSGITRTDVPVIVYLAVDGKDLFTVGRVQGLSARLGIDDGKTLVRKDCGAAYVDATPVRSAVAYLLRHFQCFTSEFRSLGLYVENTCYSTHGCSCFRD